VVRKTNDHPVVQINQVHWIRLCLTFLVFVILSIGLAYALQTLVGRFNLPLYKFAWLAYLLVFGISLVVNLSVLVPVPLGVSVMIAAATKWNPLLIALFSSLGGALGELSGYYVGYLGKKLAIPETVGLYRIVERWVQHYGMWAILFLALQPIIPFDIGGFIAGVARMPIRKFLPALWLGKLPKYVILTYAGIGLIHFLPPWLR
jgi:uncharacterized membrane protein YdjX (TVP38/TMEM64 family)